MADQPASRFIEPVHQSVAKLLGGQQTFQAPRYQRNYAWGRTQVSVFLRDLDACLKNRLGGAEKLRHHFFGGLVTVDAKVAGSSRSNLEVVDGQQRLATFAMLVNQLKRTLVALANSLPPENQALREVLLRRVELLVSSYEIYADEIRLENVDVPRVQLSVPDQPFFAALLRGEAPEPARKSHRLLASAYGQIGEYLQAFVAQAEHDGGRAERLHLVHEVLRNEWTIIHMAATEKSDAYMLFQVLNDRGVTLTEGELLRSATLEALADVSGVEVLNEVEDHWNDMLAGEAHVVRNILGWLYASQVGEWPSPSTLVHDYLQVFFPAATVDTRLDERGVRNLLEQVRGFHAEFDRVTNIVAGAWPPSLSEGVSAWKRNRLRLLTLHLRYTDCVALLASACLLKPMDFASLVLCLERFAFRFAVLGEGPEDKAREVLNRYAVDIRRSPETFRLAPLKADLAALCEAHVPLDVFRRVVEDLRYVKSEIGNKPLKYLLMTLEDFASWYSQNPQGSPVCRDETRVLDFEAGTIEHVYARNADAPDATLDPVVDTLGNLTFLSGAENDAAAAKGFTQKRPLFAKSASLMNREIAERTDWTAQVVETRTAQLVEMSARIFTP
jgi:hypothetical protein